MVEHKFGGSWTDDKLERLRKYLHAYTTIFRTNPKARWFRTTYLDGFAGTVYRQDADPQDNERMRLIFEAEDGGGSLDFEEAQNFKKGSAIIALETEPGFDRYFFIDQRAEYVRNLETLKDEFPNRASKIEIHQGDANNLLQQWCRDLTRKDRAVVFLDPYGMQVDWTTLDALAATKAVDLWLLFPLGQSVIRLLTRKEPPAAWAHALTRIFGTDEWKDRFYREPKQFDLFSDQDKDLQRAATLKEVGDFFVERLKSIFKGVPTPLPLMNSRNNPLFLLCFAASNPTGAKTAYKIARDILKS